MDLAIEVSKVDVTAFARSNNLFAASLWPTMGDGNEVFSPINLQFAMALAYSGSEGETREQIASALRYTSPMAHRAAGALLNRWKHEYSQHFTIANRLFGAEGPSWSQSYLDFTRSAYDAPFEVLDFSSSPNEGRQRINSWVEVLTLHRLRNVLPRRSIHEGTQMILVSAVHFGAHWAIPFLPSRTESATFYAPGGPIQVPMMVRPRAKVRYGKIPGGRVVEVPYHDRRLSMVIALPVAADGISALEEAFSPETFADWVAALRWHRFIALHLPKFRVTPSLVQLDEQLQGLGMLRTFRDDAQFGPMFDPGADSRALDGLFHRTLIAVDEAGTETDMIPEPVRRSAARWPPPPCADIVVDRPFLFFIRDNETNAIIFMGRVVRPEQ